MVEQVVVYTVRTAASSVSAATLLILMETHFGALVVLGVNLNVHSILSPPEMKLIWMKAATIKIAALFRVGSGPSVRQETEEDDLPAATVRNPRTKQLLQERLPQILPSLFLENRNQLYIKRKKALP